MQKTTLNPHYLMLLTIALIATSFPVGAAITNALPPAVMMFIRFLFAAVLFAPYIFIKHGFYLPPKRSLVYYAILSLSSVIFFWCMFESLRYTSMLNTGALYTLVPAITAVYAFFINGEVTSRMRYFGLLLGTLGALWIVFKGDYAAFIGLELNYGDLIFIIGCLSMALYTPLVKKFHRGEPTEIMSFWVIILGAVWLLIASGASLSSVEWNLISVKTYSGILYLAFFTTLISFFLLQLCIMKIGATKVAAYNFLTPIFVIMISVVLENEFELITLPGIILVIVAMLIIQYESSQKETV
ncbi:MAG: EamA family transporter [Gammaproteobacteria bacterium]|nr:MAG: EamA family transporter [Gammaproteobacteria bacterium]